MIKGLPHLVKIIWSGVKILLSILFYFRLAYAAEKYDVRGIVRGINDKVTVELAGTKKGSKTNKKGLFKLKNVLEGQYTLQVIADKKVIHEQSLYVSDDMEVEIFVGSPGMISGNVVSNRKSGSRYGKTVLSKNPKDKFLELSEILHQRKISINKNENFFPQKSYELNENDFNQPKTIYGVIDRKISDKKGRFEFRWLQKGQNRVIAYKPGTKFYAEFNIKLKSSDKIKLDINLTENKYDKYVQNKLNEWNKYKIYFVTKYLKEKNTKFFNDLSKDYYLSLFD